MKFTSSALSLLLASAVLAHGPPAEDGTERREWTQDDDEELMRKWGFEVSLLQIRSLRFCFLLVWFFKSIVIGR